MWHFCGTMGHPKLCSGLCMVVLAARPTQWGGFGTGAFRFPSFPNNELWILTKCSITKWHQLWNLTVNVVKVPHSFISNGTWPKWKHQVPLKSSFPVLLYCILTFQHQWDSSFVDNYSESICYFITVVKHWMHIPQSYTHYCVWTNRQQEDIVYGNNTGNLRTVEQSEEEIKINKCTNL